MSVDFSALSASWAEWSNLAGLAHVATSIAHHGSAVDFASSDGSFHLEQDNGWWVLDEVDERGQRYEGTARFSTFDLAQKYLVWRWASIARSALGAPQLGRRLQSLGVNPGVAVLPTDREYVSELRLPNGAAIIPASQVPVFSHVLSMSFDEIGQLVRQNLNSA